MDTYWNTNCNCIKCARCVKACQEQGKNFLSGRRDGYISGTSDYVPCHHCGDDGFGNKPCQKVCHYNAIEIERS